MAAWKHHPAGAHTLPAKTPYKFLPSRAPKTAASEDREHVHAHACTICWQAAWHKHLDRAKRTHQEMAPSYFSASGRSSASALSRFVLSSHAYSGWKRMRLPSQPPRPSLWRYVPAQRPQCRVHAHPRAAAVRFRGPSGAATCMLDKVCCEALSRTRAVPGEADHKGPVVSKVRGPEVFGVDERCRNVLLDLPVRLTVEGRQGGVGGVGVEGLGVRVECGAAAGEGAARGGGGRGEQQRRQRAACRAGTGRWRTRAQLGPAPGAPSDACDWPRQAPCQ